MQSITGRLVRPVSFPAFASAAADARRVGEFQPNARDGSCKAVATHLFELPDASCSGCADALEGVGRGVGVRALSRKSACATPNRHRPTHLRTNCLQRSEPRPESIRANACAIGPNLLRERACFSKPLKKSHLLKARCESCWFKVRSRVVVGRRSRPAAADAATTSLKKK